MKSESILLRLTADEKLGFEQAAELAGLTTSAWIRERLRLAAIRDLETAGLRAPFIKPLGQADG
ncbi:plasmid mobilization protein [Nitrobacter vulgaris]|nr:hypothetical protein [Nitrobacter vulgaris]